MPSLEAKIFIGFVTFVILAIGIKEGEKELSKNPPQELTVKIVSRSDPPKTTPTGGPACNVPMKDGSYEETRCNDLEELAKDWLFYRKKTLIAHHQGDEKAANKYRRDFERTNQWLSKYKDSDISNTIARLEGR